MPGDRQPDDDQSDDRGPRRPVPSAPAPMPSGARPGRAGHREARRLSIEAPGRGARRVMRHDPRRRAVPMEMKLGERGWAVQRLLGRAVEHELDDRDVVAGDDLRHARRDAVLEVARQRLRVARRAAALDAVVHDEGDVVVSTPSRTPVAVALEAQVRLADLRRVAPARDRLVVRGGRRLEQLLGELGLRRAQPAAHGADRNAAHLGDGLVRARAGEVAQHDRQAQRLGQPLQRRPHPVAQRAAFDRSPARCRARHAHDGPRA